MRNHGLVKTIKFENPKYVGDPLNAVKIFNEKEADELIVLDIDATVKNTEPNYRIIENLAIECRMPLCYGGGIKEVRQAEKILGLGVEKIALSSGAIYNPKIVSDLSKRIGSQSVVVVLDAKKKRFTSKYYVVTHNGKNSTGKEIEWMAKYFEDLGAGEIVINSCDFDGVMQGYDLQLIDIVRKSISVPMTVIGGAGSLDDIGKLIEKCGIVGAAGGSVFVFKGKYRAVLISYPSPADKNSLIQNCFHRN